VLQYVAACSSELQRVASRQGRVGCSRLVAGELQRVSACFSVLQRAAACCNVLQRVVVWIGSVGASRSIAGVLQGQLQVCCRGWQHIAGCCRMLQGVAGCCRESAP